MPSDPHLPKRFYPVLRHWLFTSFLLAGSVPVFCFAFSNFYVLFLLSASFPTYVSHWSWLVYGRNKMHVGRFGSLDFPFFGWTKPDARSSCWLVVTLVSRLLFSLSQRKFVKPNTVLCIVLSRVRYPDGLKVTFKFVLAAVIIVNVGIVHFVRICGEIAQLSLQSLTKYYAMKFIILDGSEKTTSMYCPLSTLTNYLSICVFHLFHKIICAKLHTFHSVADFFSCMSSLCTHKQTHIYVNILYLLTFFWERCKGNFFCYRILM